jgi:hypothetical protein
MCAMDRVARFLMGQLAPPPMGQTATPYRENWLTRV